MVLGKTFVRWLATAVTVAVFAGTLSSCGEESESVTLRRDTTQTSLYATSTQPETEESQSSIAPATAGPASSATTKPVGGAEITTRPEVIDNIKNLIIGVEYAVPGLAKTYAQLGISGVKYYPDSFGWGKMQSGPNAEIDFSVMDAYVREYQSAGFRDLVIALKSASSWASKHPLNNFSPKPQYEQDYAQWIRSVAERYDADGKNDMPGLSAAVTLFEIGVEFSSYEPESPEDYLHMLELAYKAAHEANPQARIMHAAFLVSGAFVNNPAPADYERSFNGVDKRIMTHSLEDMRKILDRPALFDMVNMHALAYPGEIEQTIAWLRYEMHRRGYDKPIFISDTAVNPFLGYGSAMITAGAPAKLPILSPPATETDRERLKAYFTDLINKDTRSLAWVHAFCAADMVKKIVIAADADAYAINTAFMEEFEPGKSMLFGAAAGNCSWSGMTLTKVSGPNGQRSVTEIRPSFYAVKQLAAHLYGYTDIERILTADKGVRLYRISADGGSFYVVWYEPTVLVLPGDPPAKKTVNVSGLPENIRVEFMIARGGQTKADTVSRKTQNGKAAVEITEYPCYIIPG